MAVPIGEAPFDAASERSGTLSSLIRSAAVDGETISHIKARIAQCRQLAAFTTDKHVAKILLQMAEEAEADLRRIGAETVDEPPQILIEVGTPKTGA